MDAPKTRDPRLDLAKAAAISLVLISHLHPLRIAATNNSTTWASFFEEGFDFFYQQVSLIAVPTFILVSLYLFFQNLDDRPLERMRKRLIRVGAVFIFWTTCQFAVYYVIESRIQGGLRNVSISYPIERLVMEGGPPLPIVGGSVFYFLFLLLGLVLCSTLFYLLRKFPKIFTFVGIMVVIVSLWYFETQNLHSRGLPYWRIDSYLIYIPLAFLLLRQTGGKLFRYLPYISLLGFILFSAHDVYLRNQGVHLSSYGRVSIVFGSMALFSFILQFKSISAGTISTFLSKYSLGIFATHKYWQLVIVLVFNYFSFAPPNFLLDLRALTEAFLIISFTCTSVYLAGRTPLRRYVT